MQTTYTYTNGKISKLVQEFDAVKVEASRKLAKKVAEITAGAPRVKTPPLAPITKQAGSMACNSSQSVGSSKAQANLAKCKGTWEMQKQICTVALTEAKIAEFTATFAGDFAPCVEFAANPRIAGPKVTGTFEQIQQTIAPIWLGFKITRIENISFALKSENVIVVSQVYDNHLIDASGVEIPGTANKAMEVTQTVTYDADGKISAWVQEYDAKKVQSSRNMAACREVFDIEVKMAMGDIDEAKIAEFGAKLAEFFTPKVDMCVNPKSSGPKVRGGTFVEVVECSGPTVMGGTFAEAVSVSGEIWLGFKNTSIENKSFVAKRDGSIEVTQVYQHHLTDASGAEVAGTALTSQLVQTMFYTEDGKIWSWVQEFDESKVQAARKAQIMSLCKETCIAQAQLAMGEVNQEMLAEFGKRFASSFTPTFEMVVNPQIPGPRVTGTFSEVMEVVSPIWIGFKNKRIESMSFRAKSDNEVFVTQVCHQQLLDMSGEEVPGASHILEMQTTYTYTNGKISKLVQEFDAVKVEASRKLAKKALPSLLTGGAPKVETLVKTATPKPVACFGFLKACMSGVSGKLLRRVLRRSAQ
jgi:hypothetical protein